MSRRPSGQGLRILVVLVGVLPAMVLLTAADAATRPLVRSTCILEDGERGVVDAVLGPVELRLVDGQVVRLAGLEAPTGPTAPLARTTLGDLSVGREIDLRQAGQRHDRYGRILAHVHLAGQARSLQQKLVARGLARVAATPDGGTCLDSLILAENLAREAGRGLWADANAAVKRHGAPSLRHGDQLYELVEGRILSTGRTRRAVYLNFGHDWSSDFTVIIPASLARDMETAGVTWAALAGKRVRVRGWVEQRDGPLIRIAGPWQIEMLDD